MNHEAPVSAAHAKWTFREMFAGATSPRVTHYSTGGVSYISGLPDVFGNFAMGLELDELPTCAEQLVKLDVPSAVFTVGIENPAVTALLEPFGYVLAASVPTMTLSIASLPNNELAEGYKFERVLEPEQAGLWADAFAKGYGIHPEVALAMSPVEIATSQSADAPLQFFQVRSGSTIAGVSMMSLIGGVAGIYCVATLPEHRGQGIGAYLTAAPLRIAQQLGHSTGILQASEMGYGVYKRLGFQDESQMQFYVRSPHGEEIHM